MPEIEVKFIDRFINELSTLSQRNMLCRRLTASFLTLVVVLNLATVALAQPQVAVRKNILRVQKVTPGIGSTTEVTVTLFFEADGTYSFADNLVFAECGNITSTIPPAGYSCVNDSLRVTWLNLTASTGEPLKYTAPGENILEVDLLVSVEGAPLQLSCEEGYCKGVALSAREVNYTILLRPARVIPEGVQLPVTISWTVDPTSLYPIAFSENPQSLRESGTDVSFQWTVFLNGTHSLSVVFEVRGENPWGELLIPPPTITASLDPRLQLSLMERYRSALNSFLQGSVGNLTELRSNITKLRDLLLNLSAQLEVQSAMMASAAAAADQASEAMSVAVSQLSSAAQRLETAENALREGVRNASAALSAAKELAQRALRNTEELERELSRLNATWLGNYTVAELVNQAKSALASMESYLNSYGKLLDQYATAKGSLYSSINELRAGAYQMRRLAGILREGSQGMSQLAKGFREAAGLIDSSILRLAASLEAQSYPEGLLEFNRTIMSQRVEPLGDPKVRSELMSDVVYVSLPLVKLKRSEPQVLAPLPKAAAQRSWSVAGLAVLLILAAALYGLYFVSSKRTKSSEEILAEIRQLRERLLRLEVG